MTPRRSRIRSSLIAIVVAGSFALLLAGCAPLTGPRVTVVNDTDSVYTIEADGTWLGTVGPRARATLAVPPLGEDPVEVVAVAPDGTIHTSVLGTRAMWDDAIDGSNPMSTWQDFACGRILLATEPFDPAVAGPVRNPCP